MNSAITIQGYQQAYEILRGLPVEADKKVLASALRIALEPVRDAAKQRVPTGTGSLRRMVKVTSYKAKKSKGEKSAAVRHVWAKRSNGEDSGNQYYGLWVHEGTKDRTAKKGKTLRFKGRNGEYVYRRVMKGVKGRPYISEAYAATGTKIVTDFGDAFSKAVTKYVNVHSK